MISMTGYGRSEMLNDNFSIAVEIRALNGKYFDVSTKIPKFLYSIDEEIKKIIKRRCLRGKLALNINIDFFKSSIDMFTLNESVFNQYVQLINQVEKKITYDFNYNIIDIIKLPNMIKNNEIKIDEDLRSNLFKIIHSAIDDLIKFRTLEGKNIERQIKECIMRLKGNVVEIENLSKSSANEKIELMKSKINTLLSDGTIKLSTERLHQEVAIIIDKENIDEEITRIKSHVDFFEKLIVSDKPIGKELVFLTQEFNREINTISNKVNNSKVSQLVVKSKNDIEVIREQALNLI